jgi:hypothetical protein
MRPVASSSSHPWLEDALAVATDFPEEVGGYLLGRGLTEAVIRGMGIGVWRGLEDPSPLATFREKFGPRGLGVVGWLSIPVRSPRGTLIGVDFRTWGEEKKNVREFRLPEAVWNPTFTGVWPDSLARIWAGGDVWLVEGLFDLAIARVLPAKDVALATGGAACSKHHIDFLARFVSPRAQVHLCYDADAAGEKQKTGWADPKTGKRYAGVPDRLLRVGVRCRAVHYGGGKDPGEIWERGGMAALRRTFRPLEV